MPRTSKPQRIQYLINVNEQQKQRYYTATGKVLPRLMCECELRNIERKKDNTIQLEKWMESECSGQIRLDHIDNNNDNNDPGNHQALCHGHNKRKNPVRNKPAKSLENKKGETAQKRNLSIHKEIGHSLSKGVRVGRRMSQIDGTHTLTRFTEMLRNEECEPPAMAFIEKVMANNDEVEYSKLVNSVALHVDCSPLTASRYVDKRCAPLIEVKGSLVENTYQIVSIDKVKHVVVKGRRITAENL